MKWYFRFPTEYLNHNLVPAGWCSVSLASRRTKLLRSDVSNQMDMKKGDNRMARLLARSYFRLHFMGDLKSKVYANRSENIEDIKQKFRQEIE